MPTGLPGIPPPELSPARWVVYVDLDAFYASCEIRDRPDLAGRPVIVGPPPSEGPSRGVVLSASYEARKFGVRSAQPVAQAARLCLEAVWVAPHFSKYEAASREVLRLLRRHSDHVVPLSIDEAAVYLDSASAEASRRTAESIQKEIGTQLRLPASIGVATTRIVAKIATDRAKPGGIVVVAPEKVASFLAPLPVGAVPGVGPRTGELLRQHGVETIGDLARLRPSEAARWLGGFGRDLVALARGVPTEAPEVDRGPRSRSTDRTFATDAHRWEELEPAVRSLATELADALERERLRYGTVGIAFRWADFTRTQRVHTHPAAQEGLPSMVGAALRLARELWEQEQHGEGRAVRTVSVRAERLAEKRQRQASLDGFPAREDPSVSSLPPGPPRPAQRSKG